MDGQENMSDNGRDGALGAWEWLMRQVENGRPVGHE